MKNNLLKKIEKLEKLHKQRRWWYRLVSVMACIVVFCTVYALILPAITMEGKPSCKMAEHQHDDTCYKIDEPVLEFVCDEKPHEHTKKCYDSKKNLICGYADFYIHTHTDKCYQNDRLICPLKEIKEHKHTSECYKTITKNSCEKKESKGHTHTEKCYTEKKTLICGMEESEGHKHDADCYDETSALVCAKEESEGHTHNDNCYKVETKLTCGLEESEGHKHTKDFQVEVTEKLICKKDEIIPHTHTKKCWDKDGKLICDQIEIKEHKHTDECIKVVKEAAKKLICNKKEHVHTEDCYAEAKALAEEDTATGTVEEITTGAAEETTTASEGKETTSSEAEESTTTAIAEKTTTAGSEETTTAIAEETTTAVEEATTAVEEATTAINEEPDVVTDEIQYICGKEEHQHTEDCYDENGNLICTLEEHIHTSECYPPEEVQEKEPVTLEASNATMTVTATYQPGVFPDETTMVLESDSLNAVEKKDWDTYLDTLTANGENIALLSQSFGIDFQDAEGVSLVPSGEIEFAVKYNEPLQAETEIEPDVKEIKTEDTKARDAKAKAAKAKTAAEEVPKEETKIEWILAEYTPDSETAIQQMDVAELSINEENQVEELSFSSEAPTQYGVVMVAARAVTGITNAQDLKNTIEKATEDTEIQLGAGFAVDSTIIVPKNNVIITLDLNGYTLTANSGGALFDISANANLIIKDSQKKNETKTDASGNNYGREATVDQNGAIVTLTYYVTESAVTNGATGATQETLKKHVVESAGAIHGNNQPVFSVTGGTLALESGIIYGGTNRAIDMTGGTANLSGGYICGFIKTGDDNNFGGAVKITGGKMNLSGSVLAANKAPNGGAIVASGGTINITSGVISGNIATRNIAGREYEIHNGGGGIYCYGNVSVMMSGGYLTNNVVSANVYFDGGGGAMMSGNSLFTLSSGYVTGNEASGGSGLRTDFGAGARIIMSGGFVAANNARSTEGGGIAIDRGGVGTITGGYITNNSANTKHWGGGGLFCADGSTLELKRVLITNNNAGGFGGGLAGCPTGKVYLYVDDGCAIYNNRDVVDGDSPHYVGDGVKQIDQDLCTGFFRSHGHKDYFCALRSSVMGTMLGGGAANWEGSAADAEGDANYREVTIAKDDVHTAERVMGLTANPSGESIDKAQGSAAVYINGNYSYTHGGGILCNGNLIVGKPTNIEVPVYMNVQAQKNLVNADLKDNDFQFEIFEKVKNEDGTESKEEKQVASGVCADDGTITFTPALVFNQEGTYVYYIREIVDGDNIHPDIQYDKTEYRITLTTKRDNGKDWYGDTKKYSYYFEEILVEKGVPSENSEEFLWTTLRNENPPEGNYVLNLTENKASFINKKLDDVSITVKKKWSDGVDNHVNDSIVVWLLRNGEKIERVELNNKNDWTYKWENLLLRGEDGTEYTYTVEEEKVPGYSPSYEISTEEKESGSYWIPADSLVAGEQYMIVSLDGVKALYISPNHQNNGFDTTDVKNVTQKTEKITINGQTYESWYESTAIDLRCIFTAQKATKGQYEGIILKNNGASANTWLLVQNANNNYLKSTSGTAYASFFELAGGSLKGQDGYNWNTNKRTVVYESGKFNTATNTAGAAKVYHLVTGDITGDSVVTITNTRNPEYNLPETGGTGTHRNTFYGLLLITFAVLGTLIQKQRRTRNINQ